MAEHGCKWRGLPKRFGNWHSIYVRMNRWAKIVQGPDGKPSIERMPVCPLTDEMKKCIEEQSK